jgi:enamine deaminase RidA (YjgF/YER057c/UK114 family)
MAQSDKIVGITPAGVARPLMPYTPAVQAGKWLFVAGQMATDFVNGLPPEIATANHNAASKLGAEAAYLFDSLKSTVAPAKADLARDTVRIWQWFVSDIPSAQQFESGDNWPNLAVSAYHKERSKYYKDAYPASTDMGIRELLVRDTTIETDLICRLDGLTNQNIAAPESLGGNVSGPYPAIRRGDFVFISGQDGTDAEGLDDAASSIWSTSAFERQAERVLTKLAAIAEAAGTDLSKAIKAEVYIGNPSYMAEVDAVWKRWFSKSPPARFVLPYMGLGRRGALIEVALTLLSGDSKIKAVTVEAPDAPEPLGHEPQALKVDDLLLFSTQMAFDSSGSIADGMKRRHAFPYYGEPGRAQMRYVMNNVAKIAQAGGTNVENIVRRACFHDDYELFQECMDEYASFFHGVKSTSTTIGLKRGPLVVDGAKFVLDLVAYVP